MSIATKAMIEAIDKYDVTIGASLKTWIVHNVKGIVVNFIKDERQWGKHSNVDDYVNSVKLSSDGMEQMVCNRDLLYRIFSFVDQVKGKGRRKREGETNDLLAYLMEGHLMREIADWRGCTVENVSCMISDLKKAIEEEFELSI